MLTYNVHPKEHFYLGVKWFFSVLLYVLLTWWLLRALTSDDLQTKALAKLFILYLTIGLSLAFLFAGIVTGRLKANSVKVGEKQFSEIYQSLKSVASKLGMNILPDLYIMQSGGILNAFAARFLGRNYIILYSEIVDEALQKDRSILEFILAHEIAHLQRGHSTKRLFTFPSQIIPLLELAYSRACEYTCDAAGVAVNFTGAHDALLLLAAGKNLYRNVNASEYSKQLDYDTFWIWLAEKFSSHPHLTNRLLELNIQPKKEERKSTVNYAPEDHSKYMP